VISARWCQFAQHLSLIHVIVAVHWMIAGCLLDLDKKEMNFSWDGAEGHLPPQFIPAAAGFRRLLSCRPIVRDQRSPVA
jgi:hypothetical protein